MKLKSSGVPTQISFKKTVKQHRPAIKVNFKNSMREELNACPRFLIHSAAVMGPEYHCFLWGGLGYAQEDFVSVPDPQALGASSKILQPVQSRDAAKLCRMSVEGEKSASA